MNKISTLENFKGLSYGRATGNTTRLVDHAIQLLFEGKIIIVYDAWENGNHEQANKYLFERIIKRMNFEHSNVNLKVDKKRLTIQIESDKYGYLY